VQWWKKDDHDELLVIVALRCAAVENKKPQQHNEKKNTKGRKGAYLVSSLFFTLCSTQALSTPLVSPHSCQATHLKP
jgi:hypothetical protein